MTPREQRIKVFEDTMQWLKDDDYLSSSIDLAKKHTEIFYDDEYPAIPIREVVNTEVTVTGDRSFQAAMRLSKENSGAKIAVMNFANAFHAGGGVTKGSSA